MQDERRRQFVHRNAANIPIKHITQDAQLTIVCKTECSKN